jgi:DNA-binding transcriptional LysR family regulator
MYYRAMAKLPAALPARSTRRRSIQLAALRGFDAAARTLSFTRAADELNLTQSSVSRQVAGLEDEIGKPLFTRRTRALVLTAAGQRLAASVRAGLAEIDRAVDGIRATGGPPRVTIATYASFASLWLVPRLAAFQRTHRDIEIRIDAGDRHVDLDAEGVDLALRWCRPGAAPAHARCLVEEELTPALTAELLARSGIALNVPADLLQLPLLDMDDATTAFSEYGWPQWLAFAGVTESVRDAASRKLFFNFIDQSVQAAVRGQGVVLARTPFLDDLLAAGSLTAPFSALRLRSGYCYYLIENRETAKLPHVAALAAWLIGEFAQRPRHPS